MHVATDDDTKTRGEFLETVSEEEQKNARKKTSHPNGTPERFRVLQIRAALSIPLHRDGDNSEYVESRPWAMPGFKAPKMEDDE